MNEPTFELNIERGREREARENRKYMMVCAIITRENELNQTAVLTALGLIQTFFVKKVFSTSNANQPFVCQPTSSKP